MLSAFQLEVDEEVKAAIIDVRGRLSRNELVHVDLSAYPKKEDYPTNGFNMEYWDLADGCGMVCCIGGWVERLHGISVDRRFLQLDEDGYTVMPDGLHDLVYPHGLDSDLWGKLTPADTVKAIDNWLDTGEPQWPTIRPDLVAVDPDLEHVFEEAGSV